MKSVLLLNASPLGADARGHALALRAVDNLRAAHPGLRLLARDLSRGGFGAVDAAYAHAIIGGAGPEAPAFRRSEALIAELEQTDALVISTPMHNYTVPAALKLWIDLVLRAGRSFGFRDGRKVGLLADRPVLVVLASGGLIGSGARQPDHLTGYLTDVLATIGIGAPQFLCLEGLARAETAQGVLAGARARLDALPVFGRAAAQRAIAS
ncbi:FMN-dependent NADH-azoreductase [Oceanicella sp. SM1341]|uniref:FMN-dependent NADH-azoreductase n=1 Tax=Oceanicella sp. SM1341 TaxID=1548889 RepID=UPI000E476F5E|nr:NAD(P)H-dependent oxidoreductase [Oceanicella sp. SM1341]